MLETAFSLPTQEFEKLLGKCDTIPLLDGIKIVWNPSQVKLLESEIIVQHLHACSLSIPEVSSKNVAGQERSFI
jgi:hypothetical protein